METTEGTQKVETNEQANQDITVKDLMPEFIQAAQDGKGFKKIITLTERLASKVNHVLKAERTTIQNKLNKSIDSINSQLRTFMDSQKAGRADFEDKYKNMHSILLRQIVHQLENRVYTAEIFNQASIKVLCRAIYDSRSPEVNAQEEYKDFFNKISEKHEKLMNDIHLENEKKNREEKEKPNVEQPVQEEKVQDGVGLQVAVSKEDSGQPVRTEAEQDGSVAEQGT